MKGEKTGVLKGKFPFNVEKHIIRNSKPICRPESKKEYLVLLDPLWVPTCKICKGLIEKKS